jgi:hypothetical protein
MEEPRDREQLRCPVCGVGTLTDIAYDELRGEAGQKQDGDSVEVVTFSCGHEVESARLEEARRDDPNVERRTSEETASPPVE